MHGQLIWMDVHVHIAQIHIQMQGVERETAAQDALPIGAQNRRLNRLRADIALVDKQASVLLRFIGDIRRADIPADTNLVDLIIDWDQMGAHLLAVYGADRVQKLSTARAVIDALPVGGVAQRDIRPR